MGNTHGHFKEHGCHKCGGSRVYANMPGKPCPYCVCMKCNGFGVFMKKHKEKHCKKGKFAKEGKGLKHKKKHK